MLINNMIILKGAFVLGIIAFGILLLMKLYFKVEIPNNSLMLIFMIIIVVCTILLTIKS